jgi:hypothetical protein
VVYRKHFIICVSCIISIQFCFQYYTLHFALHTLCYAGLYRWEHFTEMSWQFIENATKLVLQKGYTEYMQAVQNSLAGPLVENPCFVILASEERNSLRVWSRYQYVMLHTLFQAEKVDILASCDLYLEGPHFESLGTSTFLTWGFCDLPQSLQVNTRLVPWSRPQPLPTQSFQVHQTWSSCHIIQC